MMTMLRARTAAVAVLLPLTAALVAACGQPPQSNPTPPMTTASVPTPSVPTGSVSNGTAPTPAKTLTTDVDGDGLYDRVELFSLDAKHFRLTVSTAKSATASVEFSSDVPDGGALATALYGAAPLDGRKGSELVVNRWDSDAAADSDHDVDLAVYTWRSGRLVGQTAPAATQLKRWHLGDGWGTTQGYRFFDSHQRRYVDVSDLTQKYNPLRWVGRITRSVWKNGTWVRVSRRSVTLSDAKAQLYLRYSGPPVLLGVITTNISGAGATDELRSYRYVDTGSGGRYMLKVTTSTGQVVSRRLRSGMEDPLIGAGELDGVPGRELVFVNNDEEPDWSVLTWRSGTLIDEPAPAMCGQDAGGPWSGCSDETRDNFTFSIVNGSHVVVVGDLDSETLTARFARSEWRAGTWVRLAGWTEQLTGEQAGNFHNGIQGVALVKP